MAFCLRDAPASRFTRPPTYLLFPVRSVNSCLDVTAGTPFTIRSLTTLLFPGGPSPCTPHYRTSFCYYSASDTPTPRWHSRVCGPGLTPGTEFAVRTSPLP